jgi:lactoylglutathione lyase
MFDELFPIVVTSDLPRALGFYRDLLGATETYQFPAEGDPAYVSLSIGGSHLGLARQDGLDAPRNERVTLWVYATDCDTAVEHLRTAGVPVVEEPVDQPWGERMATVTDPDGNRVIVAARGVPA